MIVLTITRCKDENAMDTVEENFLTSRAYVEAIFFMLKKSDVNF